MTTNTLLGCNAAVLMLLVLLTGGRPSPVVPVTVEPAPMSFAERERAWDDLKAVAVPLPVIDPGPKTVRTIKIARQEPEPPPEPVKVAAVEPEPAPAPVPRSIRKARASGDVCQRVGRKKVMVGRYRWKCR